MSNIVYKCAYCRMLNIYIFTLNLGKVQYNRVQWVAGINTKIAVLHYLTLLKCI